MTVNEPAQRRGMRRLRGGPPVATIAVGDLGRTVRAGEAGWDHEREIRAVP